jgi:hypothetical protein
MNQRFSTLRIALVSATLLLGPMAAAHAEKLAFKGVLTGAAEVPSHAVGGTGTVDATLDTDGNKFHYKVVYTGLTGDATAAHFHGPALAGANAGVAVGVKGSVASPIEGDAALTPEQTADLMAGKWYFNVHTAANPGGELRGQMERAK